MTDQTRQAYEVCPGVTQVAGSPVTSDTVRLTAAEAAFDLALGRIRRKPEATGRRARRRRTRKVDADVGN